MNRPDIDHSKIILYGRSLGGAVAIALASLEDYSDDILALIVENTFTSIPDIAIHLFSWIKNLPKVFYRNQVRDGFDLISFRLNSFDLLSFHLISFVSMQLGLI